MKNCILKIISDALFEFRNKDKDERKMLSRLYKNFCLKSQVLFFFGADRWTNCKRMKKMGIV